MNWLHTIWLYIRWPLAVLVVFYVLIVIYRIPAVGEKQRTEEAVAKIQAQKITLSDVNGTAPPSMPMKDENDATVAGIDKNNNGIRDDVELEIFRLHPDSAKIRAAELQYAMAQQMFLTHVFNTETWKVAAEFDARAYDCILSTKVPGLSKEIEDLVFNTTQRISAREAAYNYTTSHGTAQGVACDIDLNSLSN